MASTYKINRGDSLSKIAAANGASLADLLALNPSITNPNLIQAGATINLPGMSGGSAKDTYIDTKTGSPQAYSSNVVTDPVTGQRSKYNSSNGAPSASGAGNARPPAPPPLTPIQQQQNTYQTAAESYIKSLGPNERVNAARQKYLSFVQSRDTGLQAISDKVIPMPFITGQRASLANQAEIQGARIQGEEKIALGEQEMLQAQSEARYKYEGTRYDDLVQQEQDRLKAQQELLKFQQDLAKPTEVGGNLVRLNPTTGKYETVYEGPKKENVRFGAIGTDPFSGATQYGWIDDNNMTVMGGGGGAGGGAAGGGLPSTPGSTGPLTKAQREAATSLSQSLAGRQEYKDAQDIQSGLQGVTAGLASNTGLGDIAAINAFQRIIDPGVSVREGDVSLLMGASGLLNQFFSDFQVEKLRSGAKLPDNVRREMQRVANELYEGKIGQYAQNTEAIFRAQAEQYGLPFDGLIGTSFVTNAIGALIATEETKNRPAGTIVNLLLQPSSPVRDQVRALQQDSSNSPEDILEFFYPLYGQKKNSSVTRSGNIPQSNNSPGNVKRGGVADQYATGVDRFGHLIFPTSEAGKLALAADLRAKISGNSRWVGANPTIAQLGKVYAEDPNWITNVSRILGVPPTTPTASVDFNRLLAAVAKAEGYYA